MTLGDHMPTPFVPMSGTGSAKREPLLPTPPSTHMVKLDTTLTCEFVGVHTKDRRSVGCGFYYAHVCVSCISVALFLVLSIH